MKFVLQPWHLLAIIVAEYANQEQQRIIHYRRTEKVSLGWLFPLSRHSSRPCRRGPEPGAAGRRFPGESRLSSGRVAAAYILRVGISGVPTYRLPTDMGQRQRGRATPAE
jgi:hypothetical protein